MKNDVSDAKLQGATKSCDVLDIEICENNVQEISSVDMNGLPNSHRETYMGEAEFGYYYCNGCQTDWARTATQDQAQCWKLAKEHLGGTN